MAIDGPTATVIASLVTAAVVLAVSGVNVVFRLGRLEQRVENLGQAMVKLAGDTEKSFAAVATDMKKSFAAVTADMDRRFAAAAADTDRRFAAITADIDRRFAEAAVDADRRFEAVTADIDRRFEAAAADTDRRFAEAAANTDRRFDRLEEIIRTEQDATRAEIRRLAEALATHTHDADGATIFRIPPVNP